MEIQLENEVKFIHKANKLKIISRKTETYYHSPKKKVKEDILKDRILFYIIYEEVYIIIFDIKIIFVLFLFNIYFFIFLLFINKNNNNNILL